VVEPKGSLIINNSPFGDKGGVKMFLWKMHTLFLALAIVWFSIMIVEWSELK